MVTLHRTLELEPAGTGVYRGHADPAFDGAGSMFGGWTAALLLSAALKNTDASGSVSAVTVNFLKPIPCGSALILNTQRLGGGRAISHWWCDLKIESSDEVAATALVVLANRRETEQRTEPQMPEVPAPESLEVFRPPFAFYEHTDTYYALGEKWFMQSESRSLIWSRVASDHPLDPAQLVFLCDVSPPRAFYLIDGPRPCPTITLSLYIHASEDELAACGRDFILSDMIGTRAGHSLAGAKANLWSRDGVLLATTEQLQWVTGRAATLSEESLKS
jgi:acyl-CoA thioesterase